MKIKGIESSTMQQFTHLDISKNKIQNLQISNLTKLRKMFVEENKLEELQIDQITSLEELTISNGNLNKLLITNSRIEKINYNNDVSLNPLREMKIENSTIIQLFVSSTEKTILKLKNTTIENHFQFLIENSTGAEALLNSIIVVLTSVLLLTLFLNAFILRRLKNSYSKLEEKANFYAIDEENVEKLLKSKSQTKNPEIGENNSLQVEP
ncbi:MAG: hypothetical protein MHPSP_001191 [Paramarteilia canceri]